MGAITLGFGTTFIYPTPEEYFSKRINEYLNETGLNDARLEMPRAHAVARSQINIRALHSIKMQMRQNHWIVQSGRDDRQRMLWQLTPKATKLLESNLLEKDRPFQFQIFVVIHLDNELKTVTVETFENEPRGLNVYCNKSKSYCYFGKFGNA